MNRKRNIYNQYWAVFFVCSFIRFVLPSLLFSSLLFSSHSNIQLQFHSGMQDVKDNGLFGWKGRYKYRIRYNYCIDIQTRESNSTYPRILALLQMNHVVLQFLRPNHDIAVQLEDWEVLLLWILRTCIHQCNQTRGRINREKRNTKIDWMKYVHIRGVHFGPQVSIITYIMKGNDCC